MASEQGQEEDPCLALLICSPQLPEVHTNSCDNISQFSVDSITSQESKEPVFIAAGDIRRRLSEQLAHTPTAFKRDPEDPSAVALKEPWQEKVR